MKLLRTFVDKSLRGHMLSFTLDKYQVRSAGTYGKCIFNFVKNH
jgi:hypothetical protein